MATSNDNAYQRLPTSTNNGWMNWPTPRLIIALGFGLFILISLGLMAAGARNLVLVGVTLVATLIGFFLISPFGLFYGYELTGIWRTNRKQKKRVPFRTRTLTEVLNEPDDDGELTKERVERIEPNLIPLAEGRRGIYTEIRTPENRRHTLFTIGRGIGGAIRESQAQSLAVSNGLAAVLKEVSDQHGVGLQAALYMLQVPPNFTNAHAYYNGRKFDSTNPAVLALQQSYESSLTRIQLKTGDLHTGIAISVPRPLEWSKKGITDRAVYESIGYQVTEVLRQRLNMAMAYDIRRPNPFEVTMTVRGMLDPLGLDNLYLDWHHDKQLMDEHGNMPDFNDSLVMRSGILPEGWVRGHSYLRVGDTLSRTFYVPKFERSRVPAGLLNTLYNPSTNFMYGVSLVYTVVSATAESRRMALRRARQDSKRLERSGRGASMSAKERAEMKDLDSTEDFFYASRGLGVNMKLLAFTVGGNWDELASNEGRLRNMFRSNGVGLPLNPVMGRSLQIPFRAAMFGVPVGIDI